ncbi:hypothetical protein BHE74_00006284 [Ensete ventricosum]|nr:hypothetical protein GW17_00010056 [Ensete ventricosum]RWW85071.1 hypothetical protein BHE74_00006284 [Ensete ventricosum]
MGAESAAATIDRISRPRRFSLCVVLSGVEVLTSRRNRLPSLLLRIQRRFAPLLFLLLLLRYGRACRHIAVVVAFALGDPISRADARI